MPDPVAIQLDLRIPMRDAVLLYGVLYRPAQCSHFPVLLMRGPYSTQHPRYVDWAGRFARQGYGVVLSDSRGRYESDGEWAPYTCEADDGYDTQQWIGAQAWCDGNIGTFGISYPGFTQLLPAPQRSPYVKALVPIANQEDNYGHLRYNGLLQLENVMNWLWMGRRTIQNAPRDAVDWSDVNRRLPLVSALDDLADRPFYREIIRHPNFDDFWQSYSMKGRYAEVETPALVVTGWYDNLVHEGFKVFSGFRAGARTEEARSLTKLLVGPWTHTLIGSPAPFGDVEFGPGSAVDIPALHLRWYDRRLKGIANGMDEQAPIRLFVMGANVWRDEWEWPLARARATRFHLYSGGRANSSMGDGRLALEPPGDEPTDTFAYDPDDPVPTHGGQSMFIENTGPKDRRSVERRDDVLVYTTEPLAEDVEVTGAPELVLHAASSAPDTDFTATLVDVHPNGKAIHICEGIVRARFRESYTQPSLIEPGTICEYRIRLWETSNVFAAGHCIRLEVSSSNFPRFDRNLNTGEDPGLGMRVAVARQTVLHDGAHPSHLVLPVIPR
jgi:hypothetical protein